MASKSPNAARKCQPQSFCISNRNRTPSPSISWGIPCRLQACSYSRLRACSACRSPCASTKVWYGPIVTGVPRSTRCSLARYPGHHGSFLNRKPSDYRSHIKRKIHAYHVFIQAGVIAQGSLQYLAVAYPKLVWDSFGSWLRTIHPGIPPSEFVVLIFFGYPRRRRRRARRPDRASLSRGCAAVKHTFWTTPSSRRYRHGTNGCG
jgi:hypothetical protein